MSLFRRRISAGLILIILVFGKVKANTIRKKQTHNRRGSWYMRSY